MLFSGQVLFQPLQLPVSRCAGLSAALLLLGVLRHSVLPVSVQPAQLTLSKMKVSHPNKALLERMLGEGKRGRALDENPSQSDESEQGAAFIAKWGGWRPHKASHGLPAALPARPGSWACLA